MAIKKVYRSDMPGMAEAFQESAAAYNDLSNMLGEEWRPIQEEAYESYSVWEAQMIAYAELEKNGG